MGTSRKVSATGGSAGSGLCVPEAEGVLLERRSRAGRCLRVATLSWNVLWGADPVQAAADFLASLSGCPADDETDLALAAGMYVSPCPSAEEVLSASRGTPVVFEALTAEDTESWFVAHLRGGLPTLTMLRREQLVYTADQYAAFSALAEAVASGEGVIRFAGSGVSLVLFVCGENNVPQAGGCASVLRQAPAHLQADGSLGRILGGEWVILNPAHRPYWPQVKPKGFFKVGGRATDDGRTVGRTLERLLRGRRSFRDGTRAPVAVVHANNFHAARAATVPFASVVFGDQEGRLHRILGPVGGHEEGGRPAWLYSLYELREGLVPL